jgi:hypothetical protein
MFATIETKGATHIAIYVPHEGSEKSLPALARLLEQNAVFVNVGYNEAKTVQPSMNITLGDKFMVEGYSHDPIAIASSECVLSDDFVIATPQVFTSNAVQKKKLEEEQSRLRSENTYLKSEIESLKSQLRELAESGNE